MLLTPQICIPAKNFICSREHFPKKLETSPTKTSHATENELKFQLILNSVDGLINFSTWSCQPMFSYFLKCEEKLLNLSLKYVRVYLLQCLWLCCSIERGKAEKEKEIVRQFIRFPREDFIVERVCWANNSTSSLALGGRARTVKSLSASRENFPAGRNFQLSAGENPKRFQCSSSLSGSFLATPTRVCTQIVRFAARRTAKVSGKFSIR